MAFQSISVVRKKQLARLAPLISLSLQGLSRPSLLLIAKAGRHAINLGRNPGTNLEVKTVNRGTTGRERNPATAMTDRRKGGETARSERARSVTARSETARSVTARSVTARSETIEEKLRLGSLVVKAGKLRIRRTPILQEPRRCLRPEEKLGSRKRPSTWLRRRKRRGRSRWRL